MPTRTRSRSRAPFSANYQVNVAAPMNVAVIGALLIALGTGLTLLVRGLM